MPFVRSGFINLPGVSGGTYRGASMFGVYWTPQVEISVSNAYGFFITIEDTRPSYLHERRYARPLRCLSTVLGM